MLPIGTKTKFGVIVSHLARPGFDMAYWVRDEDERIIIVEREDIEPDFS